MRILVIEGSESSLKLMKVFLLRWNISGEFFSNSQDALKFFEPGRFDLLITNFGKNGEGPALIRKIKEIQPGIKIICLTGYNAREVREACLAAGCDSFLSKPFGLDEFRWECRD